MENLNVCGAEALVPADHSRDTLGELAADCYLAPGHAGPHNNGMATWAAEVREDAQDRPQGPAGLRRLPWTDGDKTAYVTPGDGIVNAIADAMESGILVTAREDVARARSLAADMAASRAELRMAIQYLARGVEDVALVADLRGERLGMEAAEDAPADEPLYEVRARIVGQALQGGRDER
ncbi:hypothetical protein ACWGQ5_21625 [Streptomyces sp. NPDC055722]